MPLAGLLSAYSRAVFQTLLAVFFGAYIPKRIFRTKTLPGVPHPKYPQLPSYPGEDEQQTEADSAHKPTPILLIEAPPPPHIAGCFPTNISRNDPFTLWLSSYLIDALNDGKTPVEVVDSTLHSAAVLGAYIFILAAATFYASYRRPARRVAGLYIAELYEYLTGFPYAPPTQWDRVLHNPSPDMNTAECWDAYGMGFYDANLFSDVEALISESTSSGIATPEDAQRYAAWINPDKLDEFTDRMMQLGFTDIRTSMEDISPPDEHPDAMLVDFRFCARSPSKEILSKIIMRVVKPSDVPKDRTDFIFWDLGEGWFRAIEECRAEENLTFMTILPFFERTDADDCSTDDAASDSENQMVLVRASSPRPPPLVLGTPTTSPTGSSASTTLPDLDAFDDLDSPTSQSPSWLATAFPKADKNLSAPGSPTEESVDESVMSTSFVVVSDGQKALDVTLAFPKFEPESDDDVEACASTVEEAATQAPSPEVVERQVEKNEDVPTDKDLQAARLLDDTPLKAETPRTKSLPAPAYEPTEALEIDLTDSLHAGDDCAPVLPPSAMEESWTEHLLESMCGQAPETDLGAMGDGDFVDVTAELEPPPEVSSLPEATASARLEVQEPADSQVASPAASGFPVTQPVIDIFRIIEETHATTDAVPEATAAWTESQTTEGSDAVENQTGPEVTAPAVEDVDSILDVFDEDLSFDNTDAAEPDNAGENASPVEDVDHGSLLGAAEATVDILPDQAVSPEVETSHTTRSPTEEAPPSFVDIPVLDDQAALGSDLDELPRITQEFADPQEESLNAEAAQPSVAVEAPPIQTEGVTKTEGHLAVEQTPVVEEEDAPTLEGASLVENASVIEDVRVEDCVVVGATVVEDAPTVEEAPAAEDTPIIEVTPAVEDTPTVEDTPAVENTTTVEDTPVVEDTPASEDMLAVEDIPAETNVAEVVPTVENAEPEAAAEDLPSAVESEDITPEVEVANVELEAVDNAISPKPEATFAQQDNTVEDSDALPLVDDVVPNAQPAASEETIKDPIGLGDFVVESDPAAESPEQLVEVTVTESEPHSLDAKDHEEGIGQPTTESDEPSSIVEDIQTQGTVTEPPEADELAKDEVIEQLYDIDESSVDVAESGSPALGDIVPANIPLPDDLDDDLSELDEVAPSPTNPADVPLPNDDDDLVSTPMPPSPVVEDSELMDFAHIEVPTGPEDVATGPAETAAAVEERGSTNAAAINEAEPEHVANAPELAVLSMEASIGTLLDAAANSVWSLSSPSEIVKQEEAKEDEIHGL